jgi:hypothetical protein
VDLSVGILDVRMIVGAPSWATILMTPRGRVPYFTVTYSLHVNQVLL